MNNTRLYYFSLTFEKRSFSSAAKLIPMSYQGLRKTISNLESELGVSLFTIQGKGTLTPTLYAESLYDFYKEYQDLNRKLKEEFAHIASKLKGELRIVASTGVFGFLGKGFIEGFLMAHPNVKIFQSELPDILCDEVLNNGENDLAITVYPFDRHFNTREMYHAERMVWVRRDDKLATKERVKFSDLENYNIGVMGPQHKNYTELLRTLAEKDMPIPNIECASEIFWLYLYADMAGRVSFTVPHVVELFNKNQNIVAKPIIGIPWGFGVSWRKDYELRDIEQSFVDYCSQYAVANCDLRAYEQP